VINNENQEQLNSQGAFDRVNIPTNPIPISICPTHTKDTWMTHKGYKDNHDGTISCIFCPWGTRLPGYIRLVNGVPVDLRTLNKSWEDLFKALNLSLTEYGA